MFAGGLGTLAYVAIVTDRHPENVRLWAERPGPSQGAAQANRPLPERAPRWVEITQSK